MSTSSPPLKSAGPRGLSSTTGLVLCLAACLSLGACTGDASGRSTRTPTTGVPGKPDTGTPATPAPAVPAAKLSAANTTVNAGETTTLTWSSSNATSCSASGGWSGSRGTSGSETIGPISRQTTFSLSCSSPGGSALVMVAIGVRGSISLSWLAPTENEDGTRLSDLAGYRIYYGDQSRLYDDSKEVDDPATTSTSIVLPSGDYYVAMTALDGQGNESAYSNEVLKTVP